MTGRAAFEAPHLPHVLLAAHGVDDRARPEEEEGLEEGVGHDVEDGRRVGAQARGQEHVAELRDRRVGEHLLDVGLGETDGGGEERRGSADHRHEPGDPRRQLVEDVGPRHHVDPGGHHGRGVDQGRDRGRAGHGVRQPDVEGDLGAFPHGADEKAEGDEGGDRHSQPARPVMREGDRRIGGDLREELAVLQAAELGEEGEHADEEGEVADPVDDERFLTRRWRDLLVVVEADQEIGAEPHPLPAHEHHQVVVAEDQEEHGTHEEVQVGEVAPVPLLVAHVAHRVDVDQKPDPGDDEEHHRRQRVEEEGEVDLELARRPGVEHPLDRLVGGAQELPDAVEGEEEREPRRSQADQGHERLGRAKAPAHAGQDRGAGEGEERDEPEQVHRRCPYQRIRFRRLTSMVRRWR